MGKMLTVDELAELLNVHRITVYRLLQSNALPGFKVGRIWRFDADQIDGWMRDRGSHKLQVQRNLPAEPAAGGRRNNRKGNVGGKP